ncbi:MAG: amidohydrolase family protein [Deltaproteobacteria bacterium]
MLIRRAEIEDAVVADLRLEGGRITEVGRDLQVHPGQPVIDARGGALIPGLHDHHIHLFALAEARRSVPCGPPQVKTRQDLATALAAAVAVAAGARDKRQWIRGIGYHESVAGDLDRHSLDSLLSDCPARIQHRSGGIWYLNSAAIKELDLDGQDFEGIERDEQGQASGRLFRGDAWLRQRLGQSAPPGLREVGALLASFGISGLTDATPANSARELEAFNEARASSALPQHLILMGGPDLPRATAPVTTAWLKVLLDDTSLPPIDSLAATISQAHGRDRRVAVHCVSRAQIFVALAAFKEAGSASGDRIEHASVCPPEAVEEIAGLGLAVVTQPGFIYDRGDRYLEDVEAADLPWLYRCRAFEDRGVALAAGTDAPFGDPDPWKAIQAAVDRRSLGGQSLGPGEALSPERALGLFTGPAERPGDPTRRVIKGAPADLCLLDRPWNKARKQLTSSLLRATIISGHLAWTDGSAR